MFKDIVLLSIFLTFFSSCKKNTSDEKNNFTSDTSAYKPYTNPILPAHTDPSICRVGDDYYIAISSLEYFPGIPIFHSKDLINWRQIGNAFTRNSQVRLTKTYKIGGVFAPTIRYNNGLFYITGSVYAEKQGAYLIYAKDPSGPWSEPIKLVKGGIDQALFFDTDGTVYITENGEYKPNGGIFQYKIDLKSGKALTEKKLVWTGTGGTYPEGSRLFKRDKYYYLTIAEGGSEMGHYQTIARSESPDGPFESYSRNPIISNVNAQGNPLQGAAHADFIEDHKGNWWVTFLAFRVRGYPYFHLLGRETCILPVTWTNDGWPLVGDDGVVRETSRGPLLAQKPWPTSPSLDSFDSQTIPLGYQMLRNPDFEQYSLTERKGWLRLKGSGKTLDDESTMAFLGKIQQHYNFEANTMLDFNPIDLEEAGMTVRHGEEFHYEIAIGKENNKRVIKTQYTIGLFKGTVSKEYIKEGPIKLQLRGTPDFYYFAYQQGNEPLKELGKCETKFLAIEVAGGFKPPYVGMYSTGNKKESKAYADFDYFEYMKK